MRYLAVILSSFLTIGCVTSSDGNSSTDEPNQVKPPKIIRKVDPEFPPRLRSAGVTGVVALQATIDKFGRILNPRVARTSDPRLDEFALAAIRKWQFKPGTLNGEAVETLFEVEMAFHPKR